MGNFFGAFEMVSKCANSKCSSIFRYLHEGRLFQIPAHLSSKSALQSTRKDEFFWLCDQCCREMTIVVDPLLGAQPVMRAKARAAVTAR